MKPRQPDNMTRSQRLLFEARKGGAKFRTTNATHHVSVGGAQSLPPPFPPIRLRRAEEVDIIRTTSGLQPTHINDASLEYDFSSDYLLRDYPLAGEWRELDAEGQSEQRCAEDRGARGAFIDAAADRALALEANVISSMGGGNALYTLATDKGLVVPYEWFGRTADDIFGHLDQLQIRMRQQQLLDSEAKTLLEGSGGASSADDVVMADAALRAKVATATTLLWRMLTQVQSVVPGMNTALHLFEEFILPSTYTNMGEAFIDSPPLSSLSEQLKMLGHSKIATLVTTELEAARRANALLEKRNGYLRKALENWGFQIWRGATRASKRKEIGLERLGQLVQRAPDDRLKRSVFSAWKLFLVQSRVSKVNDRFASGYQQYIDNSPNEGRTMARVKTLVNAVLAVGPNSGDSTDHDLRPVALSPSPPPTQAATKTKTFLSIKTSNPNDPVQSVENTCETMLKKIKQLDDIGITLREQNLHQVNTINRLDRDLKEATAKIDTLTTQLLDLNAQKLALLNVVHEKELEFLEMERTRRRLVSKNKLQLHGPWRQTSMRFLAETCGIVVPPDEKGMLADRYLSKELLAAEGAAAIADDSDVAMLPTREEVMFGRLAPLVISRPSQLPDPILILTDWVNSCLDQLHDLDGQGDAGPYAARLTDVADLAVGTVLPRLLYYLALPLYRPTAEVKDLTEDSSANRLRLLTGYGCSAVPPSPSFSNTFNDVVRLPSGVRMLALIEFASDLISGRSHAEAHPISSQESSILQSSAFDSAPGSDASSPSPATVAARMYISSRMPAKLGAGTEEDDSEAIMSKGKLLVAASLPDLRDVVSPSLLSNGCRDSAVTLLAVLYLRFSHAFNHKAIVEQVEEEQIIRALAEEALESRQQIEQAMKEHQESCATAVSPSGTLSKANPNPFKDILQAFTTENKTPWQIYFERCRPMVGSAANGFLAKGNFWDSTSLESSETFGIFGRLMLAMKASLEHHRWHVLSNCLLSGPSSSMGAGKPIFHGPFASPITFMRQQLKQSPSATAAKPLKLLDQRAITSMLLFRGDLALQSYTTSPYDPCGALLSPADAAQLSTNNEGIQAFAAKYSHEWCELFLSKCTAMALDNPACAEGSTTSVVWTLPSWRMFWRELGATADMLDDELLTDLFQSAGASYRSPEQVIPLLKQHSVNSDGSSSGDEDDTATEPIAMLPTFNWHLYTTVAQRMPHPVIADMDEEGFYYPTHCGFSLPLVPREGEGLYRGVQELSFGEWLEAMLRAISILLPMRQLATNPIEDFTASAYALVPSDAINDMLPLRLALEWFLFTKVLGPFASSSSPLTPRIRLQSFIQGAYVEEVIRYHHTALRSIFEYYGKYRGPPLREGAPTTDPVCITIDFADWYAMLKEASAINGTDFNQATLMEIFLSVAVEMRSHQNIPPPSKTLQPRPPYANNDPRRLSPAAAAAASAAISKTNLLPFAHFPLSLAIIAQMRYPNPLRALHFRLHSFLLKVLETPLRGKIPALNAVMQLRRGQGDDLWAV